MGPSPVPPPTPALPTTEALRGGESARKRQTKDSPVVHVPSAPFGSVGRRDVPVHLRPCALTGSCAAQQRQTVVPVQRRGGPHCFRLRTGAYVFLAVSLHCTGACVCVARTQDGSRVIWSYSSPPVPQKGASHSQTMLMSLF